MNEQQEKVEQRQTEADERQRRILAATADFLHGAGRQAKPARGDQRPAERQDGLFTDSNTGARKA